MAKMLNLCIHESRSCRSNNGSPGNLSSCSHLCFVVLLFAKLATAKIILLTVATGVNLNLQKGSVLDQQVGF